MRLAVALLAATAVGIGAVPRILLAAGALPDVLRPFVWSDPLFVYARGLSGHRLPYVDAPFEYPPLVGAWSALFSLLATDGAVFVALWAALAAICAGGAAWWLASAGQERATIRHFALAPQLLLLGTLNFDLLAVAFLVAALVAARARHELRAGAAIALGAASKLFPLALAPIAVARSARPASVAVVSAGVLAACYMPAILAGRSAGTSLGYYLVGIDANLDSPWGLLARIATVLGVPEAQLLVAIVTLIGLAATYVFAVLPRARVADPVGAFGLAIVTVLLWSRLYSPQYSLWLLPFFVLLPLGRRLFALLAAGDVVVFLSISPLTLVRSAPDDPFAGVLLGGLVAGIAIRLAALVGTWRALRRLTA